MSAERMSQKLTLEEIFHAAHLFDHLSKLCILWEEFLHVPYWYTSASGYAIYTTCLLTEQLSSFQMIQLCEKLIWITNIPYRTNLFIGINVRAKHLLFLITVHIWNINELLKILLKYWIFVNYNCKYTHLFWKQKILTDSKRKSHGWQPSHLKLTRQPAQSNG